MTKLQQVIKSRIGEHWYEFLEEEFDKQYFKELVYKIAVDRKTFTVYPPAGDVLRAFKLTSLNSVKIVIVAQDPYSDGNAQGLAFASNSNNPSLDKIMKQLDFYEEFGEIEMNIGRNPSLEYLAEQGVLLLNRVLTVRRRQVRSHTNMGWEIFTNKVIKELSARKKRIVFMLWGKDAQTLIQVIDPINNKILTAEHPAAAAYANRPWHDMMCFSKANEYLRSINKGIIKW